MRRPGWSRTVVALGLAVSLGLWQPAVAGAIEPPVFDPALDHPPPDGVPAPVAEMQQRTECQTSLVLRGTDLSKQPASVAFGVNDIKRFATGAGQRVAVIDTGVNPNVRLPHLIGGGDYVTDTDGLVDCDHHGTLVAGIIGAQFRPEDGFVGVAPDAEIISIRQLSSAYSEKSAGSHLDEGAKAAGTLSTLARAIVHAADMGATVINMSVQACVPANVPVDLHELMGAVHYAAVDKNVVLVAAAGNLQGEGNPMASKCEKNPGPSPDNPTDERGWGNVKSLSLPSMFSQYVLSVAGSTTEGDPYGHTMTGPWVGVAAPAVNIVSLNPASDASNQGTLVNGQIAQNKPTPLNGTSFAAPYVSGLAALIRQKYPQLSAAQVIRRITNSAHTPAANMVGMVGFGIVDAKAALTADVPVGEWHPSAAASRKLPPPRAPLTPDNTARNVGFAVIGGAGVLALLVVVAGFARRRG